MCEPLGGGCCKIALGTHGRASCPLLVIFLPGARKCSEAMEAGAGGLSVEEAGPGGGGVNLELGPGQASRESG